MPTLSLRVSPYTQELLDAASSRSTESRNALADRLLNEALRTEHHPLIRFRTGAAGRRRAAIVGTRLDVYQVVATVRAEDSIAAAAQYLGLAEASVRAAVNYYADFAADVDADAVVADRASEEERSRWERQQAAMA